MEPAEIVDRALDLVAGRPGTQLAVIVRAGSQVNLRWAANRITTNGDVRSREVDVVAMTGTSSGAAGAATATVSGKVAGVADVEDLVARALAAAADAPPAEDAMPLPDGGSDPDWSAGPETTSAAVLGPLATGLAAMFAAGDVEHSGYAEHDCVTTFLGTTGGTRRRHTQTTGRAEFTAKSADRSRSAWAGFAQADLPGLEIAGVAHHLRDSLTRQERRVTMDPGRHTVLLSPSATADLMLELYWAMDARAAAEGHNVFSGPDGTTLVGSQLGVPVRLHSDPDDVGDSMACSPFETSAAASTTSSPFDNGLALHPTEWIRAGTLEHLITTRYSAALTGLAITPAIGNLTLDAGGSGDLADIIARTEDALLITCLWYNRIVDPQTLLVTGLTRDGVYRIRDGEIVGSCGNFRFNESPVGLLRRIVDSGTPARTLAREFGDYFNRAVMPALVVTEFNLSTASDAM